MKIKLSCQNLCESKGSANIAEERLKSDWYTFRCGQSMNRWDTAGRSVLHHNDVSRFV